MHVHIPGVGLLLLILLWWHATLRAKVPSRQRSLFCGTHYHESILRYGRLQGVVARDACMMRPLLEADSVVLAARGYVIAAAALLPEQLSRAAAVARVAALCKDRALLHWQRGECGKEAGLISSVVVLLPTLAAHE